MHIHMPDTTKLEQMILDLTSEMKSGFQKVDSRFDSLEWVVLDLQDEMRSNDAQVRTLLHQAFTHIADQLGKDGEDVQSFVPKYPRR